MYENIKTHQSWLESPRFTQGLGRENHIKQLLQDSILNVKVIEEEHLSQPWGWGSR
jgi:hypothetical protein